MQFEWDDRQKQSVTLDIEVTVLNFYKHLASENGIPYQELMKLYLSQYANENKKSIIAQQKEATQSLGQLLLSFKPYLIQHF